MGFDGVPRMGFYEPLHHTYSITMPEWEVILQ